MDRFFIRRIDVVIVDFEDREIFFIEECEWFFRRYELVNKILVIWC